MFGSHVRADGTALLAFNYVDTGQAYAAGDFSAWEPLPMQAQEDGWWFIEVPARETGVIRYKFVANGTWFNDQFNLRRSPDGENSLLFVGAAGGRLSRGSFPSYALGREKAYTIYLPPGYLPGRSTDYPSVVLLPGLLDDENTWADRTDLAATADRLMTGGRVAEMVLVMPDKDDSMFDETSWDAYGAYIHEDLRGHVTVEYGLPADGDNWGIEGLSLGGAWALRLSARHPESYLSVSGLSCAFSDDIAWSLADSAETLRRRGVRFRLACGDLEGPELFEATLGFGRFIRSLGLSCETRMDHGPHDWPLWRDQLPHSLSFHGWTFSNADR